MGNLEGRKLFEEKGEKKEKKKYEPPLYYLQQLVKRQQKNQKVQMLHSNYHKCYLIQDVG